MAKNPPPPQVVTPKKLRKYLRRMTVGFISTAIVVWPTIGAEGAASIPDFSGLWAREYFGFEQPESGPGPVANLSRIPTGQSNLRQMVGDYTNPILMPWAAEVLKKRGEVSLRGAAFPIPSNQCGPQPMPYILWQQEIQLLQERDQITILYMQDHHVRHVRLNGQHPARVTPSWSGDSIGHYEGDTLVIDTVGVKVGPLSMVDLLGTPQSEAVHVVERYRLIEYDAAIEANKRAEKDNIRVPGDAILGEGVGIDPDYKGKGLQLTLTVEDTNVFTTPWSAINTYRRALGEWVERVCAENPHQYSAEKDNAIPTAEKPNF
jgi:hypothetical protein